MNERVDVPQIVRADDNERRADRKMVTLRMYKPPLDGTPDLHKKFDMWVASRVNATLDKHFPGYPWSSSCDARQGVIYFGIPVLMGPTLRWVIRLAEWEDLTEKLVKDGGGELLERFNLPRTGFEAASFIHSRDHRWLADASMKKRA
jgi:hypothetical protein